MKQLIRAALVLPLAGAFSGCTSYLVQQQGKPWPGHYADCPTVYGSTRMEISSIAWTFSGESSPPDSCLGHYYPKSDKDSFYLGVNQWLTPLYVLSLPMDVMVDTVTLPLAASGVFTD